MSELTIEARYEKTTGHKLPIGYANPDNGYDEDWVALVLEFAQNELNTRPNDAWIRVEDEPKENGHYQIWDNGYGEGIFRNGEWKSTDRPIKNAMGVQCLRVTLHPTHYMPLPTPPKQLSEGE